MDKICRICFKQENSIYYCLNGMDKDRSVTFLEMITSIADIKNVTSEEHNKICSSCKVKATEAYDFKMLIERSDMILRQKNPNKLIKFNNINEIKNKLQYKEEVDTKHLLPTIDFMRRIDEEKSCTTYNNTIITKIHCGSNKEMPALDFLQSIKMEIKNEDLISAYDDDVEGHSTYSNEDDEYIPLKPVKNKHKKKKKTSKAMKSGVISNVRIKPIYLKDVRVLYYDPQETKRKKELNKKKYYRNYRKDICAYCGKLTKSLKVHQLVHTGERQYKCDICPKAYLTEATLKHHKMSHSNIRNFKCDLCTAAFLGANQLLRHKQTHSNIISFFCNVCNKGFKRKTTLTRHLRQHNSENRNIKCELCSMTFYTKPALRHHMRVHTGERPYKCEICSQPYSYKRDFNRHCFKKHGVFLNRRSVNVMNEEVLKRERALMNELLLRKQGLIKGDLPFNPFEGPQSAIAFQQVMQILENRPVHEDF